MKVESTFTLILISIAFLVLLWTRIKLRERRQRRHRNYTIRQLRTPPRPVSRIDPIPPGHIRIRTPDGQTHLIKKRAHHRPSG